MSPKDDAERSSEERSGAGKTKLLLGQVASVLGILVAISVVFIPNFTTNATFSAIVLGGVGYVLGARRLAIATLIIAAVALIFGYLVINGYIPGMDPAGVNEQSPD